MAAEGERPAAKVLFMRPVSGAHLPAVVAAIEFVATQHGGAERMLELHYPMASGLCAGCTACPTRHPCQAARIAQLAKRHPKYRDPRVQ
jgi:hypothetical protein